MSWMAKLYETYEQGMLLKIPDEQKLMPISHTLQNAHINIVLDAQGHFLDAKVLEKKQVILPATEKSAGRSSGEAPHPLADKLQYVAADYDDYGGKKKNYFKSYVDQLTKWCDSNFSHAKAKAVLAYIEKKSVIRDLVAAGICYVDDNDCLLCSWPYEVTEDQPLPMLFKVLPKESGQFDQGNALVCWSVQTEGEPLANTWDDESLFESWINFDAMTAGEPMLCCVAGSEKPLATNHPAKVRHTGDKAKLISANDNSGFTYRGRFLSGNQAVGVSFEVTQKAHNALRWLVSRQGARNGEQVVIAWAVSGKEVPNPAEGIDPWVIEDFEEVDESADIKIVSTTDHTKDLGQSFAVSLKMYIKGYRSKLNPSESIVIMVLDSATPGRMGICYYRDFFAHEYLQVIEKWHLQFAWFQRVTKEEKLQDKTKNVVRWLVAAPTPWNIMQASYGSVVKSNEALKKQLYERLLPCIVEERAMPVDIVNLAVSRASNRNGCENWEWERNLGVACALYRGYCHPQRQHDSMKQKEYNMALEIDLNTRDYLYGRLLAVAERIEEMAMFAAKEPARTTHASRLMQRFSDRPASSWLNICKSLVPYQQRLKAKIPGLAAAYENLLDEIINAFQVNDFSSDKRLSGEYLLGFHCQRKWLREHKFKKGQWVEKNETTNLSEDFEGELL